MWIPRLKDLYRANPAMKTPTLPDPYAPQVPPPRRDDYTGVRLDAVLEASKRIAEAQR